ncbi:glycosyltransferase family 4 protein [Pseudoduganella namucuonensis]|uniref:Glycosyltransferase involved in cell wall bisynthesis n=1 Tax=Pseudoduganella namucuonensis TaxID=1035707 RepID=A0A1I7K2S1_9BURK|nr:glycosyltransferase family 4 protein [Pseudoduganella namucuonensis]SFU91746.1 Glycosyltransferase involved in cell wall bisynthesis [Pseudoduganella namucuonensis]
MLKIAIVTHTLAADRMPVLAALAGMPGVTVCLIAAAPASEPAAQPAAGPLPRVRHLRRNIDVLDALRDSAPDVVLTDGFKAIHLYAFAYARRNGVAHVTLTGDDAGPPRKEGALRRMLRRYVYAHTQSYVAAGGDGMAELERYRLPPALRFLSPPCVDNAAYALAPQAEAPFDLLFCGHMEQGRNPMFALDLAVELAKRLRRRMRILFVGSGSQEALVRQSASLYPGLVDATFAGLVAPRGLPALYASARLFVFPASGGQRGVAVNQACAAGLPVLASPGAGTLVRDGENGFVCELDLAKWADRAEMLLTCEAARCAYAACSRALVASHTLSEAATAMAQACSLAVTRQRRESAAGRKYASRPRVVVVERQLLQYRVGVYTRLRELLEGAGIELQLLVGEGTPEEKMKRNEAHLPWAEVIPTRYLLQQMLCWQPFGRQARDADLVIVMHENKILYNLWLMFWARPKRLAFWGHGANLQSDRPQGWKERFKRWTVKKADWWFAYTELSADLIAAAGFPVERTTVVENAVDTDEMIALCAQVGEAELAERRRQLNLGEGPVGLYLGSLYKEKRLGFLLESAQRIRERLPGFQLLVVGAGPDEALMAEAAARQPWIHVLGPLQGRDKCVAMLLADVMLNPGLVGLGILDSFASGRPMFTTDCGLHSPEIAYLHSGENGVMTADGVAPFADAVTEVLRSPSELARLAGGARASASRYTVDNMAQRLSSGIGDALAVH